MNAPADLKPWRSFPLIGITRTQGQIELAKNGTSLDIRMRVNGKWAWFAVSLAEVRYFLKGDDETVLLRADSDGNAEELTS